MDHKHIILVCALGWLCTVSARPFQLGAAYKQDAENQVYYPYFGLKQDQDVSEQGYRISLPQLQSGQANQQGIRYYTYPANAKQQILRLPFARKEGGRVTLPQKQAFGYNQVFNWAQQQDDSNEQGITIPFSRQQGFTLNIPSGYEQSYSIPPWQRKMAKQEGITFNYPQKESSTAEKESITFNYPENERNADQAEEMGGIFNWPQQEMKGAKEQELMDILDKLLANEE